MSRFTFADDELHLPKGAWARATRQMLRRDGNPVLGLTQGRQRAYVYPLYSPAGFAVTSESPADHPHHNSMWIAADHVHALMPVADGKHEEYTYNFYVDETFQGRSPGRLIAVESEFEPQGENGGLITQRIEWRGPAEWAAPQGRLVAMETRTLRIALVEGRYVIDVDSQLTGADFDFSLGPTRHAYFNLRVADSMTVLNGGSIADDRGGRCGEAVTGVGARWVRYEGPVGGGNVASVAIFPHPADHADLSWFVTDWGVMTVGPFRLKGRLVKRGESLRARYRVLIADGSMDAATVQQLFDVYRDPTGGLTPS